jgi:hypothetical protein
MPGAMSNSLIRFGESVPGYEIPVLNERAVRASAGILFLFAIVSFMNAWQQGNFQPTRLFVVAFLVDFTIRVFVNPRFAPSLIVGQWMVRHQQPEYVGAPQKRFAWAIGLALAATMFYLIVVNNVIGPVNLIVCALCLLLLFFETAFGICLGCKIYNLFHRDQAQLCPGGACEVPPARGLGLSAVEIAILAVFVALLVGVAQWVTHQQPPKTATAPAAAPVRDAAEAERCRVPDFAKALGHEEMWKLHNNCK